MLDFLFGLFLYGIEGMLLSAAYYVVNNIVYAFI